MNYFKIKYEYEILLYLLKEKTYGRKLSKDLGTSLTRIQSTLEYLRNINVIDYKTEGKNHIYFIKKNLISKSYVLNSENYKLIKLIMKHNFLEPLFIEITNKFPNVLLLLFGSYAKFKANDDSDIDIYACTDNKNIKKKINNIFSKISTKIGKFNIDDPLIKEMINNHVIIQGSEEYYEKLKFFA